MEDDIGNEVDLRVVLRGNFCNLWPNCLIKFNDQIMFDHSVENIVDLKLRIKLCEDNCLIISHHGKRNGENRIWDTKLENNQIVADRSLHVDEISIMGISLKPWWHKGKYIVDNEYTDIHQYLETLHFYKNSTYCLDFSAPFYDWLIDARREGYKEVGPTWKMSSLNTRADGYSSSLLELEPILDRISETVNKL